MTSRLQYNYPGTTLNFLSPRAYHDVFDAEKDRAGRLYWSGPSSGNTAYNGILYWTAFLPDQKSTMAYTTVQRTSIALPQSTPALTTGVSSTFTTNLAGSPTSTPSPSVTAGPSSRRQSKAWIAGAIIGPVAVIGLIIGAFLWGGRRARHTKSKSVSEDNDPSVVEDGLGDEQAYQKGSGPPAELSNESPLTELSSARPPAELSSMGPPAELPSVEPPVELENTETTRNSLP